MSNNTDSRSLTHKLGTLFGLIGIALFFSAAVLYFQARRPSISFWVLLVLGLGSVVAFGAIRLEQVIEAVRSRQAVYGVNVIVAVALAAGIAIVVNVIVAQSFDKEFDWTAEKTFTLSEQTKKILQSLNKDVKITAFFNTDPASAHLQQQYEEAQDLLGRYQRESKLIELEFIDPIANPQKVEEYQIERWGNTTVFEHNKKREQVTSVDEQKFTSAILKVTRDEIKKIYFLKGHGERAIDDYAEPGFNRAKEALEAQNYQIEELLLATQPGVPNDCSVLIIPSPNSAFSAHEIDALRKYLDEARGKALIMLDPSMTPVDPNEKLIKLLDEWGIVVKNDLVFDLESSAFILSVGQVPTIPSIKKFEYHQITRDIAYLVPFTLARSVSPKETLVPDVTVNSLAKTSEQEGVSWGETSKNAEGNFVFDDYTKGKDTPSPVSLAVALERERDKPADEEGLGEIDTRMVVFGDADFASNHNFNYGKDLFLNAVNWLTMEEDLISIAPPEKPEERSLRIMSPREGRRVQLLSVFTIPLVIFVIGIVVWWIRR